MIIHYGFSLVGKSHLVKKTCCQDAHRVLKMENGWIIAAVADGVGSAKNSQIGSRIAVDTVVEFCNEHMPWDYNLISIKSMMRTAYNYAFKQILRESKKSNEPIDSYDTTLTMVIYDGKRIIYGHSGDGAIIGLTVYGDYIEVTKPQKGPDGVTVIPLRSGYTQWVIDTYEEDLASVMLMTDGMLDTLCPYLLKDITNKKDNIYMPLGLYFSDPTGWPEDADELSGEFNEIKSFIESSDDYDSNDFYSRLTKVLIQKIPDDCSSIIDGYKKNNYPVILMNNEQDDKTLVALINTDSSVETKTASFYSEPDWIALQDAWNRLAYPHLYAEPEDNSPSEDMTTEEDKAKESDNKDVEETDKSTKPVERTIEHISSDTKEDIDEDIDDLEDLLKKTKAIESESQVANTNNSLQSSSSVAGDNPSPKEKKEDIPATPIKHEKPKKKSLLDKIGDLFRS